MTDVPHRFLSTLAALLLAVLTVVACSPEQQDAPADAPRWNILFVFADDWGRYAGAYADIDARPGINGILHTPNIDRVAREGAVFRHAFASAPSCTPSRSALMSGRHFFNTGRGAILKTAVWDGSVPSYPFALRDAGYRIGKSYKVWRPGHPADAPFGGQEYAYQGFSERNVKFSHYVSRRMKEGIGLTEASAEVLDGVRGNFADFLDDVDEDESWHYLFGPSNTHRTWTEGSAQTLWSIDPSALQGQMPAYLPDVADIRQDVADYLGEVQALDAYVGVLIDELESRGQLDRTLIVLSGDHGMPGFPHGKATLYDGGTGVALIVRVPGGTPGRVVDDFVSLVDIAPTLIEIAGAPPLDGADGRSLLPHLLSKDSGQIEAERTQVITGRERHFVSARPGLLPYPQRALRTEDYLYIRNFAPDRWPMGSPQGVADGPRFADFDGSPTKDWILKHKDDPAGQVYYRRELLHRPSEELYDLVSDPDQIRNLAANPDYAAILKSLAERLIKELELAGDPRLQGDGLHFEKPPFTDTVIDRRKREEK